MDYVCVSATVAFQIEKNLYWGTVLCEVILVSDILHKEHGGMKR